MSGTYKIRRWTDTEEMHQQTNQWLSELLFFRDEQQFFNGLVTDHTSAIIKDNLLRLSKKLVGRLVDLENKLDRYFKIFTEHRNRLEILLDHVDQEDLEIEYRKQHLYLLTKFEIYRDEYYGLKKDIFRLLSDLRYREKQKRLLQ